MLLVFAEILNALRLVLLLSVILAVEVLGIDYTANVRRTGVQLFRSLRLYFDLLAAHTLDLP